MKPELIGWLKDGLLHLHLGGTVQSYLNRSRFTNVPPAQRSELASLLETAAMVAHLREIPVPAPRAEPANKARFLGSAAVLHESAVARRSSLGWSLWPRFVRAVVSVVVILTLLLGAGTRVVNVAAASLPGSALYPIKLAVEDARLLLTPGDLRRAELYLRYANERTEEMLQLCAAGQPVDQAVVDRFALQLESAVSAAASVAHGSEPGSAMGILEEVIKTASEQHHTLSEASVVASETVQPALNAGAAAAQQSGQVAQRELAELIAVLPTPTKLAQLLATATHTARTAEPTATSTPRPVAQPTQPPPAVPNATEVAVARPTAGISTTAMPGPTRTVPSDVSPTPVALASVTVVSPGATRTDVGSTRTPLPAATILTPVVTSPPGEVSATPTPPVARFRINLDDGTDPVPASFRIHYTACVVNEGAASLTNASVRIRWTPAQCAYVPPDNPTSLTFAIGLLEAGSRVCVNFSLNTSVICGGSQIATEAVMSCDQGSTSETETTTLGKPPTPTPTVTRTPVVLFALTISDQPDPVPAGNALHLELCVINHGDQPLSNIVLEDIWSPRDCVYLAPDNPFRIRWTWKSLPAHSRQCVSLALNSYSTCEGSLVSNRATMTCDQGTASAEERTTVGRPPTATPTHAATATLAEPPLTTPTPVATEVASPTLSPTATEKPTETATPTLASS